MPQIFQITHVTDEFFTRVIQEISLLKAWRQATVIVPNKREKDPSLASSY